MHQFNMLHPSLIVKESCGWRTLIRLTACSGECINIGQPMKVSTDVHIEQLR